MTITIDIPLAASILLWTAVIVLAILAASRGTILLREGAKEGSLDFLRVLPRIGVGIIGSGYFAEIVPQAFILQWLGPNSGLLGVTIAVVAGAFTPGGVVVGFAIGATALKSGAGTPQVIAFATAWSLFALQRMINWELAMLPARIVWLRMAASLPLPFLAAFGAMLIGKP